MPGRGGPIGDMSQTDLGSAPSLELLGLEPDAQGVLPSQSLARAAEVGIIDSGDFRIPPSSIQPASIDLRLGERAYRIRCSFLPDKGSVEAKLQEFKVDEIDLRREGAVLETNRPYLIPLIEELRLPPDVQGKANPKSSTGRLDVFTRVITDRSSRFDEIRPGYQGKLYLEVVPLSFTVRVSQYLSLNQLRLSVGRPRLQDEEIRALHHDQHLLYRGQRAIPDDDLAISDGLFLGLDLRGDESGQVGYRAREHTPPLEMARTGHYDWKNYWDPVHRENGDRIVLAPERFYLLLSEEAIQIPPDYAAEMVAYDPTSGELRTHYAGFFDPGFGFDEAGRFHGSRAALEVRAHDVPFMIEHGQRVCKVSFERMAARPERLYGDSIGSAYQQQSDTLSKHFNTPIGEDSEPRAQTKQRPEEPGLFDDFPSGNKS